MKKIVSLLLAVLFAATGAAFSQHDEIVNWDAWKLVSVEGAKSKRTISADGPTGGEALAVEITEGGGGLVWQNQLKFVLPLEKGKDYELKFRMKAEGDPAPIAVGAFMNGDPYSSLAPNEEFEAKKDWKEFVYKFTPTEDEPNARISFHLNVPGATFYLADVSLTEK